MIRAPVPIIEHDDELELSKTDGPDDCKPKKHRSSNSLSASDFGTGSEEPAENEDVFALEADNENHADDEIEEPSDYEEQKRRRSFERKVHRQTQRRGSVEDYEQSDDVQFVQRIQSYNSLTGKEIARLQTASPKMKRQAAPKPSHEKSQQTSKGMSPGHQRKNTLDLWKEKAAQMKDTPMFPPHQTTIASHVQSINSKPKKPTSFQSLAEEETNDDSQPSDGDNCCYLPEQKPKRELKAHERSATLHDWKSRAEQATLKQSAEPDGDFTTIEDQSWATNVKGGDTLKRFKQKQQRSIASSDFFTAPDSLVAEESIVEESESPSARIPDSQSDVSNYTTSEDGNARDPLMRELIRDCLRVIGTMSQSGLINQKQKLALKGLTLRKDKRIVEIAKRFRQCKNNAEHADERELIMHDMELAFARFACNID